MDKFRATGTAHIIAISGFNIAVISACLIQVFSRFMRRYVSLIVAVGVILLYTILVGADPPVVRAALIGGLSSVALIFGRKGDALTSLAVAAGIMTAWRPFVLWDTGFLLSFGASLGMILYSDKFRQWVEAALQRARWSDALKRVVQSIGDALLTTLAAQVMTLPLMLILFRQFSPLSLVANALVLPVQPAVMYLGSTAAMAGWVSLRVGQWLGWAAWLCLTYTIRCVELVARWVGASGNVGHVPAAFPVVYYGILIACTWRPLRTRLSPKALWLELRRGFPVKAMVTALLIALVLVGLALTSLPDGRLHVTFLDVGQGDAILVQTPSGRRLLIDGGPSPSTLLAAVGRRIPFWDRRIDLVLLSHPHDDHLQGLLAILDRYSVGQVLTSDIPCDTALCKEWQTKLEDRQVPVLVVRQPLQVELGDGPVLQIFPAQFSSSEEAQQPSLVARLSWQQVTCLFTGDLEADGLQRLEPMGLTLPCTVLKVPHHGSDKAVNEEFLSVAQPEVAIISVGAGNRFGHPAPGTLQLLDRLAIQTWRTDQAGDIQCLVDARGYHVSAQRGASNSFLR
jgi:competence protein ComEC